MAAIARIVGCATFCAIVFNRVGIEPFSIESLIAIMGLLLAIQYGAEVAQ